MTTATTRGELEIRSPDVDGMDEILTSDACAFLVALHRVFEPRRHEALEVRRRRQEHIDANSPLDFLTETASVRDDPHWRVAPAPADLLDRRVEITGPIARKMMLNALNSGLASSWPTARMPTRLPGPT
jgi:malate synthase